MIATRLTLRDFRTYEAAGGDLGAGRTGVGGRHGGGQTNQLEGRDVAGPGRAGRPAPEREGGGFGAPGVRQGVQLGLRAAGAIAPGLLLSGFDWLFGEDVTARGLSSTQTGTGSEGLSRSSN